MTGGERGFIGVSRERIYSPGKIDADRAILEAVAERLGQGNPVEVVEGEDLRSQIAPATVVFAMCQGPAALATLHQWEADGVRVVNSPTAIENCHRWRMTPALARAAVRCPETLVLSTASDSELPPWLASGAWLKRGDVHATEADDVVFVTDPTTAAAAMERCRARGIETVVIQRHVRGDVIKFYAVAGRFFAWFPPANRPLSLEADEVARMRALAEHGAAALGLEIFGGDCVRAAPHDLWLIDLNDWPSYAPCLGAAAEAIAAYLNAQNEKARS